jgi:hypothetical protein
VYLVTLNFYEASHGYYTPRLLDLEGINPRLRSAEEINRESTTQPYATLGYCWGAPNFLTLAAPNIEQFTKGVLL